MTSRCLPQAPMVASHRRLHISVTDDVSDNSVDTDQYVTISSFELVSALATDPNIWSGHSLGSNIDPADEWAFVRLGGTFTSEVTDVRFYYQLIDETPPPSMSTHWGRAARIEDLASYTAPSGEDGLFELLPVSYEWANYT